MSESKQIQRVLQTIKVMAGHEVQGLTNAQIARLVHTSEPRCHGDLKNLELAGLAEKLHDGRWRLGAGIVQIAITHQDGLARMRSALASVEARYQVAA